MNRIFNIASYLSLDVVLGSVGSSILAVKVLGVSLPAAYWFVLPLCVWIIYTCDHLLDAYKLQEGAVMGRHYFHHVHRAAIAISLMVAMALTLVLIAGLGTDVILYGLGIGVLVLAYLLTNHVANGSFKFFPREPIIAIGYMAGTWGVPLLMKYPHIRLSHLLFLCNHFLIILSIPLLFSVYEYEADTLGKFVSFATSFGVDVAETTVVAILTMSMSVSSVSFFAGERVLSAMLFGMALCLMVIVLFRKRLSANENYRAMSDSVNVIPFLLLI